MSQKSEENEKPDEEAPAQILEISPDAISVKES